MRKFIAVAAVILMALSCFAFVPNDDSDAASDVTYTGHYVPEKKFYRTSYKTQYTGEVIHWESDMYAEESEVASKDLEFNDWVQGNKDKFTSSTLTVGKWYYFYKSGTSGQTAATFYADEKTDPVYLNKGNYTVEITDIKWASSRTNSLYLRSSGSSTDGSYLTYSLQEGDTYTFTLTGFQSIWFSSYYEFTIEYKLNASSVVTDYAPSQKATINNYYGWYSKEITLSGTYGFYEDQILFAKGSAQEKRFISEVIDTNAYYSLKNDPSNKYGSVSSSKSEYNGTYVLYMMEKCIDIICMDYYWVYSDSGEKTSKNVVLDRLSKDLTHLFANANTTFKLSVGGYDPSLYNLYLVYSGRLVKLQPDHKYVIENDYAKTYTLISEYIGTTVPSSLYTEITLETEGLTEEESNPDLIAAVCVGLCVVIFLIVFISGKKPGWSKPKADRVKRQKEQPPMQMPPREDVPASGPNENAGPNDSEQRKE